MSLSGKELLKSLSALEITLIVLAILSLVALYMPKTWFTYGLEIDPTHFPARLVSDEGGVAEASWIDQETHQWRCHSNRKFNAAFCSYVVSLTGDSWHGLDLSHYSRIAIKGEYEGNGQSLRVYLRNRNPAYYVPGDDVSTKYNLVEIPVSYLTEGTMFDMSSFSVANWWRYFRKLTLEQNYPEFTDIIFLEVQSGSFREPGMDQVHVTKFYFEGDHINDELLYRGLASIWVVAVFAFLIIKYFQLSVAEKRNAGYREELLAINETLNLQNRQFEDLAKTDPLTGVLNRMGIREPLLLGINQWKQNKIPFSLVFIDLDYFKKINDTYGHDIGDETLSAVAELLQEKLPDNCSLARWGGEEFIIACSGKTLQQATALAEELRRDLESAKLYSGTHITASFGVATLDKAGLSELIKRADEAVYKAKASGRNKVASYGNTEATQTKAGLH